MHSRDLEPRWWARWTSLLGPVDAISRPMYSPATIVHTRAPEVRITYHRCEHSSPGRLASLHTPTSSTYPRGIRPFHSRKRLIRTRENLSRFAYSSALAQKDAATPLPSLCVFDTQVPLLPPQSNYPSNVCRVQPKQSQPQNGAADYPQAHQTRLPAMNPRSRSSDKENATATPQIDPVSSRLQSGTLMASSPRPGHSPNRDQKTR